MAAAPRPPDRTTDADHHRTPQWVKIFGAVAAVLIVGFAAVHLAGGGFRHRHFPGDSTSQPKQP